MTVKPTSAMWRKLLPILTSEDPDYTAEEAAADCMATAFQLFQARAKWAVVGQVYYSDGAFLTPDDPGADRACFGLYATPREAEQAALSAVYSAATHEQLRVWVLPVEPAGATEWAKKRKSVRAGGAAPAGGMCGELHLRNGGVQLCTKPPGHEDGHGSREEGE